jgi:hypothetical protein
MTEAAIWQGLLFSIAMFVGGVMFLSLFYTKVGRAILGALISIVGMIAATLLIGFLPH